MEFPNKRSFPNKRNKTSKATGRSMFGFVGNAKTAGRMRIVIALSAVLVLLLCGSAISSLAASSENANPAKAAASMTNIDAASSKNAVNNATAGGILKADTDYWELKLGGKSIALLKTEQEARDVIKYITEKYEEKDAVSVSIEPAITIEQKTVKKGEPAPEITSDGRALAEKLLKGSEQNVEYTVKDGDTLWDIALSHDVDIDTLFQMNPGIDESTIQPGDKLTLMEGKSDVTVRVVIESKGEEEIEFETEYEDSEDLEPGEEVVITEGENGTKTVTTRTVKINGVIKLKEETTSKTTKEPITKVVMRGVDDSEESDGSDNSDDSSRDSEYDDSDDNYYDDNSSSESTSYSDNSSGSSSSGSRSSGGTSYTSSGNKQAIVDAAYAQLGVDQDCTMLVTNSLAAVGINFHSGPQGYTSLGTWTSDPEPGDICIYDTHVAIYVGGGQAVHGGWWGEGYRTTAVWSVYTSWPTFLGYIHLDI